MSSILNRARLLEKTILQPHDKIFPESFWPIWIILFQIGELNIGSCSYDIQHLLDELKGAEGGEEICKGLMAEGQDCNLPFMPGQYAAGTDKIEILLPEIPSVLQPFLKGTINAQAIGKKPDGTPVACLEVNLELE